MNNPQQSQEKTPGAVSPIRRLGALVFGDFAAISLVTIGVLMFLPIGMDGPWGRAVSAILVVRQGARRLGLAVIRNAWLWIPRCC